MEGYTTKHGNWNHPQTVANVLDNPLYSGTVHFDDVLTPDSHTAIVPPEIFNTVASMRAREYKKANKDSKYMLSGLLYCKNCGARYFVKKNPNGNLFYCCHSRAKVNKLMVKDPLCKNKNWRKDDLEKAVYKEIKRLADNPHLLYEIKKIPLEDSSGSNPKVHEEIANINIQISDLMDLYQKNDRMLQVDDIAQKIDELYQQKVILLNKIVPNGNAERHTKLFTVENARLIIAELPAAMREGNIDIIRYSLLRLLDKIEVGEGNIFFHWSFLG
jgi:site-specific DNA recombinase